MSKTSPLDVSRPWNFPPYQEARPSSMPKVGRATDTEKSRMSAFTALIIGNWSIRAAVYRQVAGADKRQPLL